METFTTIAIVYILVFNEHLFTNMFRRNPHTCDVWPEAVIKSLKETSVNNYNQFKIWNTFEKIKQLYIKTKVFWKNKMNFFCNNTNPQNRVICPPLEYYMLNLVEPTKYQEIKETNGLIDRICAQREHRRRFSFCLGQILNLNKTLDIVVNREYLGYNYRSIKRGYELSLGTPTKFRDLVHGTNCIIEAQLDTDINNNTTLKIVERSRQRSNSGGWEILGSDTDILSIRSDSPDFFVEEEVEAFL